jgi:hypothetical protein
MPVILLIDTTYFGHNFGIIVFRSSHNGIPICTMIVDYETVAQYQAIEQKIEKAGWNVQGIVCDGRRGLLG